MLKFIYFYSPLYEYYHNHINKNLNGIFDIESIKINDLNNDRNTGHTFHGGVSIKIELVIQKIKENLGKSIVFTDATIFINSNNVNKLSDFFNSYLDYDLVFCNDAGRDKCYNIGVMLINCNEKTLSFFENVLIDLINTKGWDQPVVNNHLNNENNKLLKIQFFDKKCIHSGLSFNLAYKDIFFIFKSFIHHSANLNHNFNQRLDTFKNAGLISNEEYNTNYKR